MTRYRSASITAVATIVALLSLPGCKLHLGADSINAAQNCASDSDCGPMQRCDLQAHLCAMSDDLGSAPGLPDASGMEADLVQPADAAMPPHDVAMPPDDVAMPAGDLAMPPGDATMPAPDAAATPDAARPPDLATSPDIAQRLDLAMPPPPPWLKTPGAGPLSAPERLQMTMEDVSLPSGVGLAVGDVNNDGRLDIVSGGTDFTNVVATYLGNGHGFGAPIFKDFKGLPAQPTFLKKCCKLSDTNNDGFLDLTLVVSNNGLWTDTLLGRGDGTFDNNWAPVAGDQLGGGNMGGAVDGDFDGDGIINSAATDVALDGNAIRVSLGKGGGMFQSTDVIATGRGFISHMTTADLDGDGSSDLLLQADFVMGVTVLMGRLAGPVLPRVDTASVDLGNLGQRTLGAVSTRLHRGDFNGDHLDDLVGVWQPSTKVGLFLSKGDGTFTASAVSAGTAPTDVTVADFNRDGKLDLAVANSGGSDVSILLGKGDGTFQPPSPLATGVGPVAVLAADYDRDGKMDVAVMTGMAVVVYLGKGDGTFAQGIAAPANGSTGLLVPCDVNGDSNMDLLLTQRWKGNPPANGVLLLGKGDGSFDFSLKLTPPFDDSVATGDLDGDGADDLVTTPWPMRWDFPYSAVEVRISQRDGSFANPVKYFASGTINTATIMDVDGDGKRDVVGMSYYSVAVLRGNGDGTLQRVRTIAAPDAVQYTSDRIVGADVDNNGKLDICLTRIWSDNGNGMIKGQQVSVLRNVGGW